MSAKSRRERRRNARIKPPPFHKLCPACFKSGFDERKAPHDGRPQFKCYRCDHVWTAGLSGAPWAGNGVNITGVHP